MMNIAVIGAKGYTAAELVFMLQNHPKVKIKLLADLIEKPEDFSGIYKGLPKGLKVESYSLLKIKTRKIKLAFLCLPHAAAANYVKELYNAGVKTIDLSADFRYENIKTYEKVYGPHPAKNLIKKAVYGLCEVNRQKIKKAFITANPGCYVTSALLALYPFMKEKLIKGGIIIDSKSGVSGAGRNLSQIAHFTNLYGNFYPYNIGVHRHESEIKEQLEIFSNRKQTIVFSPHLLPVKRGIISTIYADLTKKISEEKCLEILNKYYAREKFVKAVSFIPEIRFINRTNSCMITARIHPENGKLILVSALDNLLKGASGQAVQNMNIMCGFKEDTAVPAFTTAI